MSARISRAIIMTPRSDGADGVSTVTRLYAQALAAQLGAGVAGVEIWSLAERVRSAAIDERVTFRGAGGSRLRFAAFGFRARVDGHTLVVVQHVHLLPVALPLAWQGARVMLLLHGVEAWRRLRPLERAGCRAAWKIAAVSAHTAARFHRSNPELANRPVDVCPPGVLSLHPTALPSAQLQMTARSTPRGGAPLDAARDSAPPYALIVARMAADERYKGHDLLLDVWSNVRRAVPGARLVIAGGGDDRERLAAKAAALGLAAVVHFEGVVSAERLAALYRGATLFVMPSPNEGFGLAYVEAMSAGTPCIVAPGAAEEIVEHGATGLVVTPGDATAVERAIVRLMTRRDERDRMGAAAAETARRRFSASAFAVRLYDLLQLPPVHAAC